MFPFLEKTFTFMCVLPHAASTGWSVNELTFIHLPKPELLGHVHDNLVRRKPTSQNISQLSSSQPPTQHLAELSDHLLWFVTCHLLDFSTSLRNGNLKQRRSISSWTEESNSLSAGKNSNNTNKQFYNWFISFDIFVKKIYRWDCLKTVFKIIL